MCDPISMTVLAVTTAAAGVVAQVQSAKYQQQAIDAQLAEMNQQIDTRETAELNERLRIQRKEQARIKVAAGEAGLQIGSPGIESLLMDSLMQTQLSAERTSLNTDMDRNKAAAEANAASSRVQGPTPLGAGLQIASAGLNGYAQGRSLKIARKAASERAAI
jgi:hypothetical protein